MGSEAAPLRKGGPAMQRWLSASLSADYMSFTIYVPGEFLQCQSKHALMLSLMLLRSE